MQTTIIYVAEVIGIFAFAVSGAMLAAEKNLDIFGILVLGIVTAFGGGVIRDLLLGINPPAMFNNYVFLLLAALSSCLVFFIYRQRRLARRLLVYCRRRHIRLDMPGMVNFFDAIGLGAFSVSGVNVALDNGFVDNPLLAITVGVITGIGGGMLRDLLNGEIPSVLRKNVYALAAILGAGCYYLLMHIGVTSLLSVLIGCGLTIAVRLAATAFRWHLPRPNPEKNQ